MRKKKVLFIGMSSIVGGIETFILSIFLHLKDRYKFEFINTSNNSMAYSNIIKANGGVIRQMPLNGNKFRYFIRYYYAKKFFKKHHDYSLIHINASTINKMFWVKAAEKYGMHNIIFHAHADSSDKPFLYKFISKYLVRKNRGYLEIHPNIVKWAASARCGRWMFGHSSHFQVIYNGVNTNTFKFNLNDRLLIRKELNINNNTKVILTTSRISRQKNYPKIINVFRMIHRQIPTVKLVIVGKGSEYDKVKEMVKSYKLTNSVYFLGQKKREVIPKYLSMADMMLMPSFHEGLPFALIEAQSAGLPALVSTGIPYDANVTNNVRYLSLNRSDKQWADVAMQILREPIDKVKMNEHVQKSNFSLGKSINRIISSYKEIINQ